MDDLALEAQRGRDDRDVGEGAVAVISSNRCNCHVVGVYRLGGGRDLEISTRELP